MQPARTGQNYNLYHGTLEARPVTATTSNLLYTLVFDNSMLPARAGRDERATFTTTLQNMKDRSSPKAVRGRQ